MSKIKILFPIIVLFAVGSIILIPQNDNRLSYAPNSVYANEVVTSAYPVGNSAPVTGDSSAAYPVSDPAEESETGEVAPANVEAYPIDPNEIEPNQTPTPTPASPTIQVTKTYTVYLPLIFNRSNPVKNGTIKFSVAGAADRYNIGGDGLEYQLVERVVPSEQKGEAYSWEIIFPHTTSSIQMIQPCTILREKGDGFNPIYERKYRDNPNDKHPLCWDPIQGRFAKVIKETNSDDCEYGEYCLDVEIDSNSTQGETELKNLIAANPNWIWIVGNEPDNPSKSALPPGGTIKMRAENSVVEDFEVGDHERYADFYMAMYNLVETAYEENNLNFEPRLVFCQALFARIDPEGRGLTYCEEAFNSLHELALDKNRQGKDYIYALGTHQYLHDVESINGVDYKHGELLAENILPEAINIWISYLEQFEQWAEREGMGNKPLWLTEFGSLEARCFEEHTPIGNPQLRIGEDHEGGRLCENNGGNNIFYGRNNREGLWGLQTKQTEYLSQNDNNWTYAWWFVSEQSKNNDGLCNTTAWIWGSDFDCEGGNNRWDISRAGETYFQSIDWVMNKKSAPITVTQSTITLTNPTTSASTTLSSSSTTNTNIETCKSTVRSSCSTKSVECKIQYHIDHEWEDGFTASINILNKGHTNIDGWSLKWDFPNGQMINDNWGGQFDQQEASVNVENAEWNKVIEPNQTASTGTGFLASHNGNIHPEYFFLNGVFCPVETSYENPTPTPTPSPASTGGSCHIIYNPTSDWGSGFVVDITIRNDDSIDINGWTLMWTFPNDQTINLTPGSFWNGVYTQSGNEVTVTTNPENPHEGVIGKNGGTHSFGFQGTYSENNEIPNDFMLNGVLCPVESSNTPIPQPTSTPIPTLTPTPTKTPSPILTIQPIATSSVTSTPTPNTSSEAKCEIEYKIGQWEDSFLVSPLVITNRSGVEINDWSLSWLSTGDETITNLWGAKHIESNDDQYVLVTTNTDTEDYNYNATIPHNESVTIGFNGTGTAQPFTQFTLDGESCILTTIDTICYDCE